ncbi:MAG: prepilin-type N-terminal cleavage/methylation domain-containing protein, partial [Tenericutes bacterium]|nr:prepilin-type N-terminal cleavage/methylation domain-containing protein [Mycoplasmatota bacterium]
MRSIHMKNKGFTLIELLAVIVILAVISLIAVPMILGVIEDSRKSSFKVTCNE